MSNTAKTRLLAAATSKTVVNINDFRNRDVVSMCEMLLQKAKSGEITGMIYTFRLDGEDQPVSAIGCYAKYPSVGLPAMLSMSEILKAHVSKNI